MYALQTFPSILWATLFVLLVVYFDSQRFLILMWYKLFLFFCSYFSCHFQEIIAKPNAMKLFLFSAKSFIILVLAFVSNAFQLIFFKCVFKSPNSFLCLWTSSFLTTICWKHPFINEWAWNSCKKSFSHTFEGFSALYSILVVYRSVFM